MRAFARALERSTRTLRVLRDTTVERDRDLVATRGFAGFVRAAWSQVESVPLSWSWHLDTYVEHIEAVQRREIRNLVVCVPPGHSKSLFFAVLWPAWSWIVDPTHAWLTAAYDLSLAHRDARKSRLLIDSEWFRRRWPEVRIAEGQRAIGEYENTRKGWRVSTTPGGGATGRHPHTQLVDDSIKPSAAKLSGGAIGAQLEIVSAWWRETMSTRGAMHTGDHALARVVIAQRIHSADLPGECIESGQYEVLNLPMHFDPLRRARTYAKREGERVQLFEDPRATSDELIWPERNTLESVAALERDLGSAASAQLEQNPVPPGGAIFRREWLSREYDVLPADATIGVISVDARFKESADSGDYVAIGVWFSDGVNHYRHDERHGRYSFTETCDVLEELVRLYPRCLTRLVENKANGPAVVDALRRRVAGLVLVEPLGGKEARAQATTGLWRAGNVHLRADAEWLPTYRAQHETFPRGRHDDLVDETSQALAYLSEGGANSMIAAMDAIRGRR